MVGESGKHRPVAVVGGVDMLRGLNYVSVLIDKQYITKTFHYLNYKTSCDRESGSDRFGEGELKNTVTADLLNAGKLRPGQVAPQRVCDRRRLRHGGEEGFLFLLRNQRRAAVLRAP
ncbi:hypothetical protein SDC9_168711 [bioreactor metagenome]|uniref:Uncharacterized protein n=1 Tax=bioreactor metagenome TaxID=1076179 RepID=A0A645G5T5_9ZZZZ